MNELSDRGSIPLSSIEMAKSLKMLLKYSVLGDFFVHFIIR